MKNILIFTTTLLLSLLLMTILVIFFNDATFAQSNPLTEEARIYSTGVGVSVDEGLRRLELQKLAGDLNADLITNEVETFAGLWIQHLPEFRVIVQFTSRANETLQRYLPEKLVKVTEARTVTASLGSLQSEQKQALADIRALGVLADSSINVVNNQIEINIPEIIQLSNSLQLDKQKLSDRVKIIPVKSLANPTADLYGGLKLDGLSGGSTAGFAVIDERGKKGITTCGHGDSILFYLHYGLPYWLPCQQSRMDNSYDIQWHASGGLNVMNEIETGLNGSREITGEVKRNNQAIGTFVSKYGKTTGYTAGYISRTDVALGYIKESQPTFIQVIHSQLFPNLVDIGDSGGPWFVGNDAYGTTSARDSLGNAYYMAIDYLSGVGVKLLTAH